MSFRSNQPVAKKRIPQVRAIVGGRQNVKDRRTGSAAREIGALRPGRIDRRVTRILSRRPFLAPASNGLSTI